MKMPILLGAAMLAALVALAADQATLDAGQKEAGVACTPCHSLRLVQSQRLSKAAWNKELDKMSGWGTKITDREALLEYLVANYGDDKPAVPPAMSKDGVPPPQRKKQ
jgi:mono/diheme cytochrome c family protein